MAIARAVPASVWLLCSSVFCCPARWKCTKCQPSLSPLDVGLCFNVLPGFLFFFLFSFHCAGLSSIWATCCTRFLWCTAWPSSARKERWRASCAWPFRPYQVRPRPAGLPLLSSVSVTRLKRHAGCDFWREWSEGALCFPPADEEAPDYGSGVRQSGTAKISFEDQQYEKVGRKKIQCMMPLFS